jgi:hypothetical protein
VVIYQAAEWVSRDWLADKRQLEMGYLAMLRRWPRIRGTLYWLGAIALVTIVGCIVLIRVFVLAVTPSLEPERISHYDPEAVPPGLKKKLPPITDPDGMRDAFFYPDGLGKGRIVHMRFPKNYVSGLLYEMPSRHDDRMNFRVIYPSLLSVMAPGPLVERKKGGGFTPDDEIGMGIHWLAPGYLTAIASGIFEKMKDAESTSSSIRFEEIPVPMGFFDANCAACRRRGIREAPNREVINQHRARDGLSPSPFDDWESTSDHYVEWNGRGEVTRMMTCGHTTRPLCILEIKFDEPGQLYILSASFHSRFLGELPELLGRIVGYFKASVVEIL